MTPGAVPVVIYRQFPWLVLVLAVIFMSLVVWQVSIEQGRQAILDCLHAGQELVECEEVFR